MKWFRNWLTACEWQDRAEEIHKETGNDCDEVSRWLIKEMQANGLVLGRDFVTVYGRVDGTRHMCVELFGKNSPDKKGRPVFKFNGYRIDGTAPGTRMKGIWKGEYGKS